MEVSLSSFLVDSHSARIVSPRFSIFWKFLTMSNCRHDRRRFAVEPVRRWVYRRHHHRCGERNDDSALRHLHRPRRRWSDVHSSHQLRHLDDYSLFILHGHVDPISRCGDFSAQFVNAARFESWTREHIGSWRGGHGSDCWSDHAAVRRRWGASSHWRILVAFRIKLIAVQL